MRKTVGILGTAIDILDTEEALERIEQFVCERRFHQVATANTDFLINALADPELRHILRIADLVVPDGMPLVWAARLLRSPLPERVTGADLVPAIAALAARQGYRLYLLGARPDVARRARARLEAENPGLQIAGCLSPPAQPLAFMEHEAILRDIERAQPDILLVAFGNPKQEKWIHMHRARLRAVPVCMGVGGTFDFLAGETVRAPLWMQRAGLEWLHRMAHDPRRLWRRYARDLTQFGRYLLLQWWAVSRRRTCGETEIYQACLDDVTVLSLVGPFQGPAVVRFQSAAAEALDSGRNLILDFQGVTGFDGEALGALINLPRRAACRGCEIRLVALPSAAEAALRRSRLDESLFRISRSVAEAFSSGRPIGLDWLVRSGTRTAVVTVSGASETAGVLALESLCNRLLDEGKEVDIDCRGVLLADMQLLTLLLRLAERAAAQKRPLRLTPGAALRSALERESIPDRFQLCSEPLHLEPLTADPGAALEYGRSSADG